MNSDYELAQLEKLLNGGQKNSRFEIIVTLINLVTFALLAVVFLTVSNYQIYLKTGLVTMAVLGFVGGTIFTYKQMLLTIEFQNKFIDKDKVEKRIGQLKT